MRRVSQPLPIIKQLLHGEIELASSITIFVGENGTGKSSLLERIAAAWGFNPEGGTRNFNFSTKPPHSELYKSLLLSKGVKRPRDGFFLRAESFYNAATAVDDLDGGVGDLLESYGGVSLHEQSHGESFMSLVENRFGGQGLYILDEPEAALSPLRQLLLISLILAVEKDNSQFIIATHSPMLMAIPGRFGIRGNAGRLTPCRLPRDRPF